MEIAFKLATTYGSTCSKKKKQTTEKSTTSKCWRKSFVPTVAYRWTKCLENATPAIQSTVMNIHKKLYNNRIKEGHTPTKVPSGLHATRLTENGASLEAEACGNFQLSGKKNSVLYYHSKNLKRHQTRDSPTEVHIGKETKSLKLYN